MMERPAGGKQQQKQMQQQMQKDPRKAFVLLGVVVLIAVALLFIFPDRRDASVSVFVDMFLEMILIIPAVLLIMGLFGVWISEETVTTYLGRGSGVRGALLAIVFGALPTGPIYAGFPLVKGLMNSGASAGNMFLLLSAWACIKLPQELIEFEFLGPEFMLWRLSLTVAVILLLSPIFERLVGASWE